MCDGSTGWEPKHAQEKESEPEPEPPSPEPEPEPATPAAEAAPEPDTPLGPPPPRPAIYGEALRVALTEKGWSLEKLASSIGSKLGTVRNWPRGRTRPLLETARAADRVLGTSLAEEYRDQLPVSLGRQTVKPAPKPRPPRWPKAGTPKPPAKTEPEPEPRQVLPATPYISMAAESFVGAVNQGMIEYFEELTEALRNIQRRRIANKEAKGK